jgi:signal transduction histidine kinase
MECLLFFKINNYYVLLHNGTIESDVPESYRQANKLFDQSIFESIVDEQFVHRSEIPQVLYNEITFSSDYYFVHKTTSIIGQYCLFIAVSVPTGLAEFIKSPFSKKRASLSDKLLSEAKNFAKDKVAQFRLAKKSKLIADLMGEDIEIANCIAAFRDYICADRYALWVYNRYSNVFSCVASSHELAQRYVAQNTNSSLHDFLNSKSLFDHREPRRDCANSEFAKEMKTLHRLRIDLEEEKGEVGILDYLSKYSNFELRPETQKLIRNFVPLKYSASIQAVQGDMHEVQKYFAKYEPGKLSPFLHDLTCEICKHFCFEACSIFLVDDSIGKSLLLEATYDKNHMGTPPKGKSYSLDQRSKTANVFKDNKMAFSYDLKEDPENSHTYDEETLSSPRNWIGLPLESNRKWGVLRVKNRYKKEPNHEIINITPNDCRYLKTICRQLSTILDVEQTHRKYVQKSENLTLKSVDLEQRLDRLKDFYNVFLHEIRTPISTFSTSPLRIKKLLERPVLDGSIIESVKAKVNDIKIIGDRLTYIVDTYYFSELVKSRQLEWLSVLGDIVLPVLNISQEYILRQFDVSTDLDDRSLEGIKIYGDKILLNIVFNTLLSNAGKYSPRSEKPIRIYGEHNSQDNFFYIVVENYGFEILEDEREKVFDKHYRGKEVRNQKIGGTGIGLFLAKAIMKHQPRGDLLLATCRNPVSFKIRLTTIS